MFLKDFSIHQNPNNLIEKSTLNPVFGVKKGFNNKK